MPYDESAIDRKVRALLEAHPELQQFGQPDDGNVWDGRTACTHTCWQIVALLWLGRKFTLNHINTYAGMPARAKTSGGSPRGMRHEESAHLVATLKLPYKLITGRPWSEVQSAQRRGPVIYGTRYGSQPDQRGAHYDGATANGLPNGYAIKNGRTQLTGFENGAHAVLGASARTLTMPSGHVVRVEELRRDPNHGSPGRHERPAYDVITVQQAEREYDDYHDVLHRVTFAWVPTKALPA